jgi:ribonucleotide monophosphatase NagD (HAD superfamily)
MTDIAMAVDAGMSSGLVLTGDSTRAEAEALASYRQPTYIVERVDELLPASLWAEQGWNAS